MSSTSILIKFKSVLINFFDELILQFPNEGDLVLLRIFLNDQIPTKDVMDIFNYKLNQDDQRLKRLIQERNDNVFLEYNIFDLDKEKTEKMNHFKKIWRSGRLDDEDKLHIWEWIDTFVKLGENYTRKLQNEQ
jgi:hypothetical protein